MNFETLMKTGWTAPSIEDDLREKLLVAETRIQQLELQLKRLREAKVSRPKYVEPPVPVVVNPGAITTRKYVFLAFSAQCFYCHAILPEHKATLDHQIPKSKGGRNSRNNLVLSCSPCNSTKGDRMPTPAELERAHVIRAAYDNRPANAEPLPAVIAPTVDTSTKPNSIYTVRREKTLAEIESDIEAKMALDRELFGN